MSNRYAFVPIDSNSRYLMCPQCGNKHFSEGANFCKMCGFYLYNSCEDHPPDFPHEEYDNYGLNEIASRINPGDARFCEHCGKETLLSRLGFLKTWDEVVKDHKEIAAGIDFTKPIRQNEETEDNSPEEDLPF